MYSIIIAAMSDKSRHDVGIYIYILLCTFPLSQSGNKALGDKLSLFKMSTKFFAYFEWVDKLCLDI